MRKLYTLVLLLISITSFGQAPQLIPYQAIARDAAGQALANESINARFTIHDETATGAAVWQEIQTVTTSALGLFTAQLGSNVSLDSINWASGSKFMQVEIDLGSGYVDLGTQQMLSVPFALFAAQSANSNTSNTTTNLPAGTEIGNTMYWDGAEWVVSNANIYNAGNNVGIGTDNPTQKFHVEGNIGLSGSIQATGANQNITIVPANGAHVDVSNSRLAHVDTAQFSADAVNAELIQYSYLNFANAQGNANALSVDLPVAISTYSPGLLVIVKATTSNSGPASINVDGLGPKAIKKNGNQDLASGDIQPNLILSLLYDGTNFQVISPINGANHNLINSNFNNTTLIYTVDGF